MYKNKKYIQNALIAAINENDQQTKEFKEWSNEIVDRLTGGNFKEPLYVINQLVYDPQGLSILIDSLNSNKKQIFQHLINTIFDDSLPEVTKLIKILKLIPIDWPEIKNLPYSIRPDIENEFRRRSDIHLKKSGAGDIYRDIEALIENGFDYLSFIDIVKKNYLKTLINSYASKEEPLSLLRDNLDGIFSFSPDTTQLVKVIEHRKTNIIKSILRAIKKNYRIDVNYMINQLRDLGIQWSEFEIIERSLSADITD